MKSFFAFVVALILAVPVLGDDKVTRRFPVQIKSLTYDVDKTTVTVEVEVPTTGYKVFATPKVYAAQPDWWTIDIEGDSPPANSPVLNQKTLHKIVIPLAEFKKGPDHTPQKIIGTQGVELVGKGKVVRLGVKE